MNAVKYAYEAISEPVEGTIITVMKEWAEDEIEVIRTKTSNIPLIGFYSYGEFSTSLVDGKCHLHNETMCVTLLREE